MISREQLQSIEWAIQDEDGDLWCPACRSHAGIGHRLDCWLAAALWAAPSAAPEVYARIEDASPTLPRIDQQRERLETLQAQLADLARQLTEARAGVEALRAERDALMAENANIRANNEGLAQSAKESGERATRLLAAYEAQQEEAVRCGEIAQKAEAERDVARARCERAEGRLREISDLLADVGVPGGTTIYGGVLTIRERAEKAEAELAAARAEAARWKPLGEAVEAEREQALAIIATLGIPDTEDQGGWPVPGATRDTLYALKWAAEQLAAARAALARIDTALRENTVDGVTWREWLSSDIHEGGRRAVLAMDGVLAGSAPTPEAQTYTNVRGETFTDEDLKRAGQDWG